MYAHGPFGTLPFGPRVPASTPHVRPGLRQGGETFPCVLTDEEVRHVAALARVAMTDDEVELMRSQLSNILDHVDVLNQVDTEGVEPTGHSVDVTSVMRDDEVGESARLEDVLANAPSTHDDFIRVKAVLE